MNQIELLRRSDVELGLLARPRSEKEMVMSIQFHPLPQIHALQHLHLSLLKFDALTPHSSKFRLECNTIGDSRALFSHQVPENRQGKESHRLLYGHYF